MGTGYGGNPATNYSDFWEYNASTNNWIQKANVPGARSFAFGLSIGDKGYIGTGYDTLNANILDDFWEYDTISNIWTQKASYPGGVRNGIDAAHFTIGNYGYVGTGHNSFSSTFYNDFWKYDPSNNLWTQIPDLPSTQRLGACGFTINSRGYIGLGYAGPNVCLNDLWEYDTTSVGILELSDKCNMIIFPNPSRGNLIVHTLNVKSMSLEIYNILGEQIYSVLLSKITSEIDISKQPQGVYFVRIHTEKYDISKKIILVK